MPVSPPLDRIPVIPAQAVSSVMESVNTQINNLQEQVIDAVERSLLPDQIDCNDPRVQAAIAAFEELMNAINRIQGLIAQVQQVAATIQTIVGVANSVKAALLINPLTAPAIIGAELLIVQNMTIANALIAVQQFQNIPGLITNTIQGLQPTLLAIAGRLAPICDTNAIQFDIDNLDLDASLSGSLDISELDKMLNEQKDLLKSLEEAPSKVYTDNGVPGSDLGKTGDYYIDLQNKLIYGPKPTRTDWADGIKFE